MSASGRANAIGTFCPGLAKRLVILFGQTDPRSLTELAPVGALTALKFVANGSSCKSHTKFIKRLMLAQPGRTKIIRALDIVVSAGCLIIREDTARRRITGVGRANILIVTGKRLAGLALALNAFLEPVANVLVIAGGIRLTGARRRCYFCSTFCRTAVAGDGVAVVAFLCRRLESITAHWLQNHTATLLARR